MKRGQIGGQTRLFEQMESTDTGSTHDSDVSISLRFEDLPLDWDGMLSDDDAAREDDGIQLQGELRAVDLTLICIEKCRAAAHHANRMCIPPGPIMGTTAHIFNYKSS